MLKVEALKRPERAESWLPAVASVLTPLQARERGVTLRFRDGLYAAREAERRGMSGPRTVETPVADKRRMIIVTGLSGAGKSNALQAFEDAGYFCIDNLPPRMIPAVMETTAQGNGDPTAWSWSWTSGAGGVSSRC